MSDAKKSPLSVIILTRNEERNIGDCLKSVSWADEIIVLDAHSTDRTSEIASAAGGTVYQTDWLGFGKTKNIGLERAKHDWILWLDADERVTPGLAVEIEAIVSASDGAHAAFTVARRAYFLGKWIRHCGWYPGYVVRLFKKSAGRFSEREVHEFVEVRGSVGRLQSDLHHFTDETLYHYFLKFNHYTTLAAVDTDHEGKKSSLCDLLLRPPFLFLKMYIIRRGFLDGFHGLLLSLLSSAYVFIKYAKIWERRHPGV
jgi:glycosyltransferase involved in cell wall biosynthesis